MRLFLISIFFILISNIAVLGQSYNMTDGSTVTTCSGTFYDPEGTSAYVDFNGSMTMTFCSSTSDPLQIVFTTFDTREANDNLAIYDGPNTSSPLIGVYSGTNSPGTVISSGTCLTFVWTTDGNQDGDPGWEATILCSSCSGTNMTCATNYNGTLGTSGSWNSYTDCFYTEPGEEHVYMYTPPFSGQYTFTATANSGDPDFFLMSTCDNTGTNIIGSCWNSGSQTVFLTGGTTYYLIVDNYSSSNNASYTVSVSCPICDPIFTLYNGGNNCPLDEFYIDVDITSLGTATSVSISNDGGYPTQTGITTTGIQTIGPFPSNTTVNVTVENEADTSCKDTKAFTTPGCPPSNDECTGAIPLTVTLGCNYNTYVIDYATASSISQPTCGSYDNSPDVWFSFTVPASGILM